MGSAASDSRASRTRDTIYFDSRSNMSVKSGDRKRFQTLEDDNDASLKLHTTKCDKMYRWSMWRMYLNEELSRAVMSSGDLHFSQSNAVADVAAHYTEHPDGMKYGRLMRKRVKRNHSSRSRFDQILPDNLYLVYGLPRISLDKKAPTTITDLHDSMHDIHKGLHVNGSSVTTPDSNQSADDTDKQITEMFDFMSNDVTKSESQLSFRRLGKINVEADIESSSVENKTKETTDDTIITNNSSLDSQQIRYNDHSRITIPPPPLFEAPSPPTEGHVESSITEALPSPPPAPPPPPPPSHTQGHQTIRSRVNYPLVSKSRLFWEKLANKRTEIIDIGKSSNGLKHNDKQNDGVTLVISTDILQKQQKLLKKTIARQRNSKDHWRNIAERKTEILTLRELNEGKDSDKKNVGSKKQESKTSQLWGFIFSKKKDLIQMKRAYKAGNGCEESPKQHHYVKRKDATPTPAVGSTIEVGDVDNTNMVGSFQDELAARLKSRRSRLAPAESTMSISTSHDFD